MKFTTGRRKSFGKLVMLLYKLGVTSRIHVPTVSNWGNLYDMGVKVRQS